MRTSADGGTVGASLFHVVSWLHRAYLSASHSCHLSKALTMILSNPVSKQRTAIYRYSLKEKDEADDCYKHFPYPLVNVCISMV